MTITGLTEGAVKGRDWLWVSNGKRVSDILPRTKSAIFEPRFLTPFVKSIGRSYLLETAETDSQPERVEHPNVATIQPFS
jgi:hypothetical protein